MKLKTPKTLPAWLVAAAEQATRDAAPDERPVLALNRVWQGVKAYPLTALPFEDWREQVAEEGKR